MILTSFIDSNQALELNDCLNQIRHLENQANGELARFTLLSRLNKMPKCVDVIRNKCLSITGHCLREPMLQDFVIRILPNGFVNIHTDTSRDGYKHIRFNILLQKPLNGGNIIFDGKQIQQNVGDCFVLDASIQHGVSKVRGNISYRSIVFGFLIPNEQKLTY
jgi:hypothetical protein